MNEGPPVGDGVRDGDLARVWVFCEALWCQQVPPAPLYTWSPLLRALGQQGSLFAPSCLAELRPDLDTSEVPHALTAFSADSPMCPILADSWPNMDAPMSIFTTQAWDVGPGRESQKNRRKNHNNRFYYLWFIEHFLCIRHCPEAINLYNKYLGSQIDSSFCFFGCAGSSCCVPAFSSCGEPGLLFVVVSGLLVVVAFLVAEHRLWGMRAQQLWCMGLAAPWHVGSSSTRDQTLVPCIGRQILLHCTGRRIGQSLLFFFYTQGFDSEWSHGLLVRTSGSQSPHGPVAPSLLLLLQCTASFLHYSMSCSLSGARTPVSASPSCLGSCWFNLLSLQTDMDPAH